MRTAFITLCLLASSASAYNVNTIASDSCHEKMLVGAFLNISKIFKAVPPAIPDDDVLHRMLATVAIPNTAGLGDSETFVLFSMIIGVRSPDTDGHSTLDLAALRRLHADSAPEGQYAHALRGPDDDYLAGDIAALDGTLRIIRDELDTALSISDSGGPAATGKRAFFIQHYGRVDVTVYLPAYHLGRAIHALQDAHAHMVWNDEVTHVVHVLNYVDAVSGVRETARDGMAHSGALDDCDRDDTQPMVEQATQRTAALVAAILILAETGDRAPLEQGLSPCPADLSELPPLGPEAPADTPLALTCGWLVYNPACRAAINANDQTVIDQVCCTAANAYCGSKFAIIAREEPAGPYLGCQSVPGSTSWLWVCVLLLGLRRRSTTLGAALVTLTLATPARAEGPRAFTAIEGHGSFLNDAPNASLLDVTFGYSLRGGYRWGRWRAVLHVEHNAWLTTEFGTHLNAGAFNLGVGAEALFFGDAVRVGLVVGPSILLFDTELDASGSTGFFGELRPLGFRYEVADGVIVTFDPMTAAVVSPVFRDPPLRKIERRTYAGLEIGFL